MHFELFMYKGKLYLNDFQNNNNNRKFLQNMTQKAEFQIQANEMNNRPAFPSCRRSVIIIVSHGAVACLFLSWCRTVASHVHWSFQLSSSGYVYRVKCTANQYGLFAKQCGSTIKLTEIVILWVYYTIPFRFSLILALLGYHFSTFVLLCLDKGHWWGFSTRNAHMTHIVN